MYGWNNSTVVRVASDGTETELPTPAGFSGSQYNVGDFDSDGHYWVTSLYSSQDGRWYEIDYAAGSATSGEVIASGNIPDAAVGGPDWVYVDGGLYSISAAGHLIKFDTTTYTSTDLGEPSGGNLPGADSTFGAGYADASGNLYFSDNTTGEIYRIDPTTNTAIDLSSGPSASGNDGARCATAPIPTVTVTKTVDGRAATADQFTVGLDEDTTTLTSATTVGTDTTAATTDWPVSEGTTYTITDAIADGSTDTLDAYAAAVVCTDTTTGDTVTTSGTAGAWSFTVPGQDAYTCAVTNTANKPAISVAKHAGTPVDVNGDGLTDVGDTIAYTFTVTNTGDTALTDVGVTDAKAGAVTCPDTTLAAGESETCTADNPYTVTAADVSNGSVTNTANEALSDVTVDDSDFSGTGTLSDVSCPETNLTVGADETCTATYTTTQADVDNGGTLTNTATAEGTPPGSDTPLPSGPSKSTVPVDQTSGLALVKTADVTKITTVGQSVTYSFAITNTGNVTQENVKPTEGTFNGSGALPTPTCPDAAASLAPGDSVTCTAVYHVTSADLTTGTLTNTRPRPAPGPMVTRPGRRPPPQRWPRLPPGPDSRLPDRTRCCP